jgi:hypothetical protein
MNEHSKDYFRCKAKFIKGGMEGIFFKCKKRQAMYPSTITKYFSGKRPYRKPNPLQFQFVEDMVVFIAKG